MKRFTLFLPGIILGITLLAQVPQAFKYQAVARDASGSVLAEKTVSFRISILSDSTTGTAIYCETHRKLTNALLVID